MQGLIKNFEDYLFEAVGMSVNPIRWQRGENLPFFLRNLYQFYQCELFGNSVLLLVERNNEEQPPGIVSKHVDQIHKHWNHDVVYVTSVMTSYNRKRFIEQKIPFVVPDNQMYLPPLGIDLREYIKKSRPSNNIKISPATQTVILYALLNDYRMEFTPTFLAHKLYYSLMTMTRAFDELKAIELGDIATEGRERILRFEMRKRDLWEKSKEHLRSPVKRSFYAVRHIEWDATLCGLSALAEYSLLMQPRFPEYAIKLNEWKPLNRTDRLEEIEVADNEPGTCKIEIWNYTPELFENKGLVDPFSLYLSLRTSEDERIQSSLEEMIEKLEW